MSESLSALQYGIQCEESARSYYAEAIKAKFGGDAETAQLVMDDTDIPNAATASHLAEIAAKESSAMTKVVGWCADDIANPRDRCALMARQVCEYIDLDWADVVTTAPVSVASIYRRLSRAWLCRRFVAVHCSKHIIPLVLPSDVGRIVFDYLIDSTVDSGAINYFLKLLSKVLVPKFVETFAENNCLAIDALAAQPAVTFSSFHDVVSRSSSDPVGRCWDWFRKHVLVQAGDDGPTRPFDVDADSMWFAPMGGMGSPVDLPRAPSPNPLERGCSRVRIKEVD